MIKIGMLSFAHMHAYGYAGCLQKMGNVQINGIYDDNVTRGKKLAKQFSTKYYADYKDLLAENIDAVVICSENSRHKELSVASAKAGKHILCEKPISVSVKDAQVMIDAAAKSKVKLQIAFPCRFSTAIIRAKEVVEQGKIGKILAMRGTNRGMMPGGWFIDKKLSGGGAVIDHTVHVVDLMRWMTKKEIKKVYAEIDNIIYGKKFDDCGMLNMEFEDGMIATLDPSWSRPLKSFPTWGDVTLKIVGTNGVIDLDMFNQKMVLYNDDRIKSQYVYWGDNIDMGLVSDFINCVENDLLPSITGYDGLKAVEVALAAYKSAKQKQSVSLPLV